MGLQIFGTRKCPDTRKAERFFRDRGVAFQLIDLAEKGISPGELASVVAAMKQKADSLLDTGGRRYRDRGLAWQDFDAQEEILADPLLLRTPIVRDGKRAAVGADPAAWEAMLPAGGGSSRT